MKIRKIIVLVSNVIFPGIGFIIIGKKKKGIAISLLPILLTLFYWQIAIQINYGYAKTTFRIIAIVFWIIVSVILFRDIARSVIKIDLIPMILVIAIIGLTYFLISVKYESYITTSENMEPTIKKGYSVIVDKIYSKIHEIKQYDIVAYNGFYPNGKTGQFISRVVGMPGDIVDLTSNENIIVNNSGIRFFSEKYNPDLFRDMYIGEIIDLKSNEYFVVGDSINNSFDSRFLGPIKKGDMIGIIRLICR
jgi:signal peptidase I